MAEVSTVAYQVMWNRLISVVEEQAQALVRTSLLYFAHTSPSRRAADTCLTRRLLYPLPF